jgi:hypothetical protein
VTRPTNGFKPEASCLASGFLLADIPAGASGGVESVWQEAVFHAKFHFTDMTRDCPKRPTSVRYERAFFFWVAALAVVLFILLHESIFGGKGLVPADGVLYYPPWNGTTHLSNYSLTDQYRNFIPQHQFVHQRILEGDFPLWNPHLGCGMPNLGSMQGALLFPIQLLLSPLDPFQASGPAAFLKLFLAGAFTMLYLRRLGGSPAGAFLSGLVFSLCGFMIVWLGHPHVNCAMWLPLLLYFVEKTFISAPGQTINPLAAPALRAWIGLAMTFGAMLLGGHPPTAVHLMIVVVVYFMFRLGGYHGGKPTLHAGLLICSLAAGLLLAAPQILPYLEYYRQSSSGLASVALHRWASHLTPNTLIHFLLPHVLGNPVVGFEDLPESLGVGKLDNFNERIGYVGILPLFLGLCAVTCRRCKFTLFFLSTMLASLLVIYGVPPIPALMRLLPVLCDINHTRLLLYVGFSAAVLAGLGWDALNRMDNRRQALRVAVGFWTAVGVALLWFWCIIGPGFHGLDQPHRTFLARQFVILAGGLIATGIVALRPARWGRWVPGVVCLGWTAIDLLCFGMGYNPAIPRNGYYPSTPAIEWLKKDPSIFRVLGSGIVLVPNTAEIYGLSDARGYDFMSVRRYEELITGNAGDFFFYWAASDLPKPFPLLNVKYVLASRKDALTSGLFEPVYSDEIIIYRYKACRERVLLVFDYQVDRDPASVLARVRSGTFDPGQVLLLEEEPERTEISGRTKTAMADLETSVCITSYEPDEVRIEAFLPRPGFLLLLDTYFPGWTANVNGWPTKIYRADYNFRAVSLPAGKAKVRFSYRPDSFRLGVALSLASLLALGAIWFWARNRSSYSQTVEPGPGPGTLPKGR